MGFSDGSGKNWAWITLGKSGVVKYKCLDSSENTRHFKEAGRVLFACPFSGGKIALQRGPLVYCLEGIDHQNGFMFDYLIPEQAEIKSQYEKDLLNGVVTLTCPGKKLVKENQRIVEKETLIKAIPYYAWNNRGRNCMLVWIPQIRNAVILMPEPTIALKSKPAASTGWVTGLNDGFEPRDSSDTDKLFFYWWLKKGTKEWVEYTFDQPYRVSGVQVYWLNFDHYDYQCRPPQTWEILYK